MKIYHRKNFIWGLIGVLMGLLLLGAAIQTGHWEIKPVVLIVICLLWGSSSLLRSLNRNLSYQDKINERDERNQLVSLKTRDRTLAILRGILFALCLGLALGVAFSAEEMRQMLLAAMLIVSGLLFTGSYIIELFCALHYENHT